MPSTYSLALLDRVAVTLRNPELHHPMHVVASLVHPRVAVVPRSGLGESGVTTGVALTLESRALGRTWRTEATVRAMDDRIAALVLHQSPWYGLPSAIFADGAPVAEDVGTVLAAWNPRLALQPVFARPEALERMAEHWVLRMPPLAPGEAGAAPVVGAPVVHGGGLLGVLERWEKGEWSLVPASVIRDSPALGTAFRSFPGGAEARMDEEAAGYESAKLFDRFDPNAREALAHAEGMRRAAGSPEVWMEHLVAGLAALPGSRTQKVLHRVGASQEGLRLLLTGLSGRPLPEPDEYEPVPLKAVPRTSTRVARALTAALGRAHGEKAPGITSWHLLVGAAGVSDSPVIQGLEKRGLAHAMDDLLRGRVFAALPVGGEAVGGVRYAADQPSGRPDEEKLGIGREVRALASMLAAKETPLPLSLGLFGDWGSGKSFFMHQMETEIARRAEASAADPHSPYCERIVQLWFNAWHYVDTNLWASLAAAIFEGIAQKLDGWDGTGPSEKRDALRAALLARTAHLQREWDDKRERKRLLDLELRNNEERLGRIRDEKSRVERELRPAALLNAAYHHALTEPLVVEHLNRATERLGIPHASSEVKARLIEMGSFRRRLWAVAGALGHHPRHAAALLLGVALSVSALTALARYGPTWGVLTTLSGLAVAVVGSFAPVAKTVGAVLASVERAQREAAASARREEERVRKDLVRERKELEVAADRAREQVERASEALTEAQRQLETLHPHRSFGDFVRERWRSGDYTRHLGVIASARNDFAALTHHLREMAALSAPTLPDGTPLPKVDRIVLYVDDLDRCPEEKVVEVLQAVHLLLAFELFVVVVGVDSRWLLHSLRHSSPALVEWKEGAPGEGRVHGRSTPLNYLEKIFQIPFTLQRMSPAGFGGLIDHLAQPSARSGRARSFTDAAPPASEAPAPASQLAVPAASVPLSVAAEADGSGGTDDATDGETGAPADEAALAERLALSDWELAFIKEMHPLIPTPRAAKRLLNVYRLIRGTLEARRFDSLAASPHSGEYRAVLVLLALLTGYPAETTIILRDLVRSRPTGSWHDYLDALEERRLAAEAARDGGDDRKSWIGNGQGDGVGPEPASHPFDGLEGVDTSRWKEMLARVRMLPLPQSLECDDFVAWARDVGRYSFYSGRVLLALAEDDGRAAFFADLPPAGSPAFPES